MPQASKSVGIWIRVSTEMQVQSDSPEHHERRARLYAEAKGWQVEEVYRLEAVSGKSVIDHPEAKRMLADVKRGKITGLVFSKLARLARNTKELLEFADYFKKQDADLISLDESLDTSSPAGRFLFVMIGALAEFERAEIASRVQASVPIRAKLGKPLGGSSPFGYVWRDGKLVPDEKEAPVRKLLYELYQEHGRKRTVARILNERGYRTRGGGTFSMTTITRLLRDPTAKGVRIANSTKNVGKSKPIARKPESEWVYHQVEPIVSEELWDACQALLDGSRSKYGKPAKRAVHLFAGYAFCGCGGKMYVKTSNKSRYVCSSCGKTKIPIVDLEGVYHEQLRTLAVSPGEVEKHFAAANETLGEKQRLLDVLSAEREKVSAERERLYELYMARGIEKEDFASRYRPFTERLEQIDQELPALQAQIDVLKINQLSEAEVRSAATNLYDRWPLLPFGEKRQIIEAITEKIVIAQEDIDISFLYQPSVETAANGLRSIRGSWRPRAGSAPGRSHGRWRGPR
jgi:site-specific DNA recombinase